MTVSTTSNRSTGTGDGATTAFTFTFAIQQSGDMDVYVASVLQGSGYTVAINSNGVGGTVTFTTAPTSGQAVLMIRSVDITQSTALPIEGNIPESTLEDMADKLTMICQQIGANTDRALTLPVTSSLSGLFTNSPTTSLCLPRLNGAGTGFEFVAPSTAFSESSPAAGGGNVTGTGSGATDYGLVLYNGATGLTLRNGPTAGTSGQLLVSAGAAALPVWTTKDFLLRAANITSSLRALPTSGALSGTYVHSGNWTSTGALTFSHDTRIYVKGSFTLSHTMTGTVQTNHGTNPAYFAGGWGRGDGRGGGDGGMITHAGLGIGGGAGGGCGGAGGRGAWNGAGGINQGGRAHNMCLSGGGGAGAGAGDLSTSGGSAGGGGGPFLYLEVDGAIAINETLSSPGASGTNATATGGAGGGGAGGWIEIRGSSTFAIASAKLVSAVGGNGGNVSGSASKGGGGGGGVVNVWTGGAHTLTGSVSVAAGTKGTGTTHTTDATDGSAGTSLMIASAAPISLF